MIKRKHDIRVLHISINGGSSFNVSRVWNSRKCSYVSENGWIKRIVCNFINDMRRLACRGGGHWLQCSVSSVFIRMTPYYWLLFYNTSSSWCIYTNGLIIRLTHTWHFAILGRQRSVMPWLHNEIMGHCCARTWEESLNLLNSRCMQAVIRWSCLYILSDYFIKTRETN